MAFDTSLNRIAIAWKGLHLSIEFEYIFSIEKNCVLKFVFVFVVYRLWWIVSIILSICLCLLTIYGHQQKWSESPVIISYDAKLISIGTIPFPAMTVCPATRISSQKFNFTKAYRSLYKLDGLSSPNMTSDEYVSHQLFFICLTVNCDPFISV